MQSYDARPGSAVPELVWTVLGSSLRSRFRVPVSDAIQIQFRRP